MTPQNFVLPTTVAPPTLLLPRSGLFATRAQRLRQLATGHALADWLNALASLCEAQHALEAQPAPELPAVESAVGALVTPAARDPLLAALPGRLQALLALLAQSPASAWAQGLAAPDAAELQQRARVNLAWAAGETAPMSRDRMDALVSAALQSLWTQAARALPVPQLSPLPGRQSCPCCGSAAHGSVVMSASGQAGLRHLECSLCGSRWHAVRARCTLCDSPHEVTYRSLEGHHPGVVAETCSDCHGYTKTLFQDKDAQVEPLADDLATLVLDVLVGEAGYGRASPNLFLLEGEPLAAPAP